MTVQINQGPQNKKVTTTPRIKIKHNNISDEEFKLLMNSQKVFDRVSFYYHYNFYTVIYNFF